MGQPKFRNFLILVGLFLIPLIQSRLNSMAGQLSKGSLEKQVHKLSPEENRKLYNIFIGAQ